MNEELKQQVVDVSRESDRLMTVKIIWGRSILHIISGYAPQVGCSEQDKEEFREHLEDLITNIPGDEPMILGADLINCHVGSTSEGYERIHSGKGYGTRNEEEERMVEMVEFGTFLHEYWIPEKGRTSGDI